MQGAAKKHVTTIKTTLRKYWMVLVEIYAIIQKLYEY